MPLTYGRLTEATGAEPIAISAAIKNLISLGVIAVQPGHVSGASVYLPDLPRAVAAWLAAAVEDAEAPPW